MSALHASLHITFPKHVWISILYSINSTVFLKLLGESRTWVRYLAYGQMLLSMSLMYSLRTPVWCGAVPKERIAQPSARFTFFSHVAFDSSPQTQEDPNLWARGWSQVQTSLATVQRWFLREDQSPLLDVSQGTWLTPVNTWSQTNLVPHSRHESMLTWLNI